MNPDGAVIGELIGGLVYDVDSDLTIAFAYPRISVYDAATNTWTQMPMPDLGDDSGYAHLGAVYDPVSGLVITSEPSQAISDGWELWAYDVDTNVWAPIGVVALDRSTGCCTGIDLLGYAPDIDRFVLATYIEEDEHNGEATLLLDPRTGETTLVRTPTPVVNLGWPGRTYGHTVDSAFVAPAQDGRVCGFDTVTSTWDRCFDAPGDRSYAAYGGIVGDPINDRLILIYGDWWANADPVVWAIDLITGQTIELVAPGD